jgi:hypothetical protein
MNNDAPGNLLDRPELPELSLNGAVLSVNGSSPHIDDQPPSRRPHRDDGMKHYCFEVTFTTGDWTDGWAGGRCEDAELIAGTIQLCLGVRAHTDEEALAKAVEAARTAIQNAGTATRRFEPIQLKLLDLDEQSEDSPGDSSDPTRGGTWRLQLLHDRKPPVPWTLLPPAEIERRTDEMNLPGWSSSDVNGAECWAVTALYSRVGSPRKPAMCSMFGCWVPE